MLLFIYLNYQKGFVMIIIVKILDQDRYFWKKHMNVFKGY